jgi:archaellum biogenesis ATPase FlaH
MAWFDFFWKKVKKREKEPYIPFKVIKTEKGDYHNFYNKLLRYSLIILIIGKRGSGKTALGMKFLELFHRETKRRCYAMGFKNAKLPLWLKKVESIEEIPNNSIALIDEGGIVFSSRESMKETNKFLGRIMSIARHKNITLLLVTQNSAMIDLNVLRLADTILLKEPSLLQSSFERKALRDIYNKIIPMFKKIEEKQEYFYVWDDEFEGFVNYELPYFWSEKIGKSFRNF